MSTLTGDASLKTLRKMVALTLWAGGCSSKRKRRRKSPSKRRERILIEIKTKTKSVPRSASMHRVPLKESATTIA